MKKNNRYIILIKFLLLLLISMLAVISLEIGNHNKNILPLPHMYVNIGTVFFIIILLTFICRKFWPAALFSMILIHILAIANYYVIIYRGVPISFDDVFNIGTAANVMNGYILTMDKSILFILSCLFCSIGLIPLLRYLDVFSCKKSLISKVFIICCGIVFFFTGYIMDNSIKPHDTLSWSWKESYYQYGYLASTIEAFTISLNPVEIPEYYDENILKEYVKQYEVSANNEQKYPDIILILNETYYDLQNIVDITTDIPYMQFYNNLNNAIKGEVVVPDIGGGTNKSEYELLTSNSLFLAPTITPFNVLNLKNSNSIVSYLEKLDYVSLGAHSRAASNYSRGKAYDDLGFDTIFFEEDFNNLSYYQKRWYESDESVYENFFRMYEMLPTNQPRFLYLLTMQNHGGYELNPEDADLVHIKEDYNEVNNQINEYLTCIYQSDLALKKLIDYFKCTERHVIVCMVGDHAPAFVNDLVTTEDVDVNIELRSTPFLIWANFPIEGENIDKIGMNALIPNLLEVAGVPLSLYYQYILDLQKEVPILTSFGIYITKNGDIYNYDENTKYTELVNQYFVMEYNNIGKDANRLQTLFTPTE